MMPLVVGNSDCLRIHQTKTAILSKKSNQYKNPSIQQDISDFDLHDTNVIAHQLRYLNPFNTPSLW